MLNQIELEKELCLTNVLSLRKLMTESQVQEEIIRIYKLLSNYGVKKNGSMVTTTFSMENLNGIQHLDMEILVPIDKEFDVSNEYTFKKAFKITNAIHLIHGQETVTLQESVECIQEFIKSNKLVPITPIYYVYQEDITSACGLNFELFIGISPNLL